MVAIAHKLYEFGNQIHSVIFFTFQEQDNFTKMNMPES